jgi:8-oxo-dGTP pyrophosphatase MutT (NUDIX family)
VLLGRRGEKHRFMPGRYVFPGGRVAPEDARPWQGEILRDSTESVHRRCTRAALRETFEETGLVLGRAGPVAGGATLTPVEAAIAAEGLVPALELLMPIGRAITPTYHRMRFDAYFFLADGALVRGRLGGGHELEELAWHPVENACPEPTPRVTRFMLQHAVAVRRGTAEPGIPFYCHIGTKPVVRRLAAAL